MAADPMTEKWGTARRPPGHYACAAVAVLLGLSCAAAVYLTGAPQFISSARAAENGNFNRLAPRYHKATDTVTFEGKTYVSDAEGMLDKDQNGVKETLLERYNAGPHQKILRYETKGIIWAWAVYRDYDDRSNAVNYVVVDRDGKGRFDTKLRTNEPFGLPGYLKGPVTQH